MKFSFDYHLHVNLANHYNDVNMSAMAFQITSLTIVYSIVYSGADQRKHQSSASIAFVRRIHRWPGNSPQKGPITRKMFPFDDVIMHCNCERRTWMRMRTCLANLLHIYPINTLSPGPKWLFICRRHFQIPFIEKIICFVLFYRSVTSYVPKCPINYKLTLVCEMAWGRKVYTSYNNMLRH